MTAKENIKRLADANKNVRHTYDEITNRLRLYLTVPSSIVWDDWQMQSDSLRKQATMRQSSVIPGLWTTDVSAPTLDGDPDTAILYRADLKCFLPMLNIAIWKRFDFVYALADAVRAASSATLYLEKHGTIPDSDALEYQGLIFTERGEGRNAAMIANAIARFNAS